MIRYALLLGLTLIVYASLSVGDVQAAPPAASQEQVSITDVSKEADGTVKNSNQKFMLTKVTVRFHPFQSGDGRLIDLYAQRFNSCSGSASGGIEYQQPAGGSNNINRTSGTGTLEIQLNVDTERGKCVQYALYPQYRENTGDAQTGNATFKGWIVQLTGTGNATTLTVINRDATRLTGQQTTTATASGGNSVSELQYRNCINSWDSAVGRVTSFDLGVGKAICALSTGITSAVTNFIGWSLKGVVGGMIRVTYIAPALATDATGNSAWDWAGPIFRLSLNLVNYVIVLTLIFLSFVNILHINIDTYGIKKIMPTLVYAVILSNFSYLFCRILFDAADVLTAAIISNPQKTITDLSQALGFGAAATSGTFLVTGGLGVILGAAPLGILAGVGFLLVLLVPFLLFMTMMLLFWVRFYVVVALAAISPLAWIAMATPLTQPYFKQWWSLLIKWVFMAPIAFFLIFVATQITRVHSIQGGFQSFLIASVILYYAIQVPFQLGGNIMNTWGGLVKKAGLWGAGRGDSYLGDFTKRVTGSRVNFSGLYGGMKEQMEKREAEKQVQAKGVGAGVEEVRRQALGTIVKGGVTGREKIASLRNVFETASRTSELSGVKQLVATGAHGKEMESAKLLDDFNAAMKIGDFNTSKDLLVMLAGNGSMTLPMFEKFFRTFKGSNAGEMTQVGAAVSQLIREVAEAPVQVFGNQVTKDAQGKVALLADIDPKAAVKEANTALAKRFSRMSTTRVVQELDYLVKQNFLDENGQPLSPDQTNSDFHQALMDQVGNERSKLTQYSANGAANQLLQRIQPTDFEVTFHPNSLNEVQGNGPIEKAALEKILADAGSNQGRSLPIKPDPQFIQDAFHLLGKNATGQDNWDEIQNALKNEFESIGGHLKASGLTIPKYDTTVGKTMLDSMSDATRTANSQKMRTDAQLERGYRKLQALERTKLNLERRRAIALEHNKTKLIKNLGLNAPRER